jgi:carbamoyl-phosphate synthase large subunit
LVAEPVAKVSEDPQDNVATRIGAGQIHLVINTPFGKNALSDGAAIRRAALAKGIPCITTLSATAATVEGIRAIRQGPLSVRALQDWYHRPCR